MSSENHPKIIHTSTNESAPNPDSVQVESAKASPSEPPKPSIGSDTKDAASYAKESQDKRDPVIVQFEQNVTEFCESMAKLMEEQQELQRKFSNLPSGRSKQEVYDDFNDAEMRSMIDEFEKDEINIEGLNREVPQGQTEVASRDDN